MAAQSIDATASLETREEDLEGDGASKGRIVRVQGSVIDIEFPVATCPTSTTL